MVLFEENFEPQIVTSNTLISLVKSNEIFSEKLRKFIWNGAEFLFNSAYVIFLYFLINGKNSDPTYDSLYMCSCQHDERLKLQYLMKISDFLYSGLCMLFL